MKILTSELYMKERHKVCCDCEEVLPIFMFKECDVSINGRISKCNKCLRKEKRKTYTCKHPKAVASRAIVATAKRAKILIEQPCETCGTTKNIQAHHMDYNKPLDVIWLCGKHHMRLHATLRYDEENTRFVHKAVEN